MNFDRKQMGYDPSWKPFLFDKKPWPLTSHVIFYDAKTGDFPALILLPWGTPFPD